ncbi:3-oxoacyl-ACP reductase family protein [Verminephrobacter aporrectodeae]|uniref:3-oxoacyl-ACP reductase family protein n=1 Tax=Verminephrobacter aporrectodeae TaxID=1110389 RepID=UPI000237826C|nr:3-oxoacyl-ACP reductase family protein [Verminephrobacter aporrectodeae]
MKLLEGKVAIVTGASRGIGRAIALGFAQQGARLVLNASTLSDALSETQDQVRELGAECALACGPVQEAASARLMVSTAADRFGGLDILVNNAGVTRDKPLLLMTEEEFDLVHAVNMRGVYQCSREAVREMMKKRSGRIISISSISAISGRPGQCNYAAAKAGVVGFTKSLAREVGKQNILVNALLVGVIDTAMTKSMQPATKAEVQRVIPLNRIGRAEEVAGPCVFLASDFSTFVTGTTINISGGGYV